MVTYQNVDITKLTTFLSGYCVIAPYVDIYHISQTMLNNLLCAQLLVCREISVLKLPNLVE